ncbi:hypothetical protein Q5752_003942 [Cryptotrichosporon argae]
MKWNLFSSASSPPSSSSSSAAPAPASVETPRPTLSRYERALADEEAYQALQYPTYDDVPGCMRLFDEFMMCYALVPQLRHIYRHGELHDCGYRFADFKYCLSLKGEDVEARRRLWVRRRAEWWAARRVGGSSEDVWDARSKPLDNFPPLYPDEDADAA